MSEFERRVQRAQQEKEARKHQEKMDKQRSADEEKEAKRLRIEAIKKSPEWRSMLALSKNPDIQKALEMEAIRWYGQTDEIEIKIVSEKPNDIGLLSEELSPEFISYRSNCIGDIRIQAYRGGVPCNGSFIEISFSENGWELHGKTVPQGLAIRHNTSYYTPEGYLNHMIDILSDDDWAKRYSED